MNRKEWLEVGKQSLYFVLLIAGIALLIGVIDLVQGWSFETEKFIIMLGLWLLTASMFLGLSPFAMDSKQRGLEYLLTLPVSRRRLLFIKLVPRLAAVVLFYGVFFLLYHFMGHDAFGGYFEFFSLVYFALFFISFSLSSIHENFIVQSIWAGFALCGFLTLCSIIMALGFAWNNSFSWGSVWRFNHFGNIIYDSSSLTAALVVFLLMLAPFVASYFLAFKKFDLKPARAFNRRQLLFFIPLLLLALAASLVISLGLQKKFYHDSVYHILENRQVLKAGWPGKLEVFRAQDRLRIDTRRSFLWAGVVCDKPGKIILPGFDVNGNSWEIIAFDPDTGAWKTLHKVPQRCLAIQPFFAFRYDGRNLIVLQRGGADAEMPNMRPTLALKNDRLDLVVLDLANGASRTLSCRSPLFVGYHQPRIFAADEIAGRRFWLVGSQDRRVLRLWRDGTVEDLGISKKMPAYFGHLLFTAY